MVPAGISESVVVTVLSSGIVSSTILDVDVISSEVSDSTSVTVSISLLSKRGSVRVCTGAPFSPPTGTSIVVTISPPPPLLNGNVSFEEYFNVLEKGSEPRLSVVRAGYSVVVDLAGGLVSDSGAPGFSVNSGTFVEYISEEVSSEAASEVVGSGSIVENSSVVV